MRVPVAGVIVADVAAISAVVGPGLQVDVDPVLLQRLSSEESLATILTLEWFLIVRSVGRLYVFRHVPHSDSALRTWFLLIVSLHVFGQTCWSGESFTTLVTIVSDGLRSAVEGLNVILESGFCDHLATIVAHDSLDSFTCLGVLN